MKYMNSHDESGTTPPSEFPTQPTTTPTPERRRQIRKLIAEQKEIVAIQAVLAADSMDKIADATLVCCDLADEMEGVGTR